MAGVKKRVTYNLFMPRRRGRRTSRQEKLARERISVLFEMAKSFSTNGDLEGSKRFIELARLISKRYNQRFTKAQRISICRSCNILFSSTNSRFRFSPKGWKVVTCLDCGNITRFKTKDSDSN